MWWTRFASFHTDKVICRGRVAPRNKGATFESTRITSLLKECDHRYGILIIFLFDYLKASISWRLNPIKPFLPHPKRVSKSSRLVFASVSTRCFSVKINHTGSDWVSGGEDWGPGVELTDDASLGDRQRLLLHYLEYSCTVVQHICVHKSFSMQANKKFFRGIYSGLPEKSPPL